MKKVRIWLLAAVLLVLLAAAGMVAHHRHYLNTHVFIDDVVYDKEITALDFRGAGVSLEHYEKVRQAFPDIAIRYDVLFQGQRYDDDTRELTITSLTEAEIGLLDYLPELEWIHAEGCRDYPQLMALRQRRPDCKITYTVTLLDRDYEDAAEEMVFSGAQPEYGELAEALKLLPDMKTVHFEQPAMTGTELVQLREDFPDIQFTWVKDALGETYSDDVTEIDLSGRKDLTLEQVEQELSWFPDLEKVVMCNCGFDDDTMAAFREKMRPHYKVVWSVMIYGLEVRTDDTYFMPVKHGVKVANYQVQRLRYCEDMICVDVGHMPVTQLDWVTGMPHLQYLIVADGPLLYIEPLSTCKELIYLELFMTEVSDFTPLLGCTALQDLNVSETNGDVMVFKDMPWLQNLWINCNGVTKREHEELQAALPNTRIESQHGLVNGNGWRDVENYFKMRDLLGMPYNTW